MQRKDRARIFPGRKKRKNGITICIENILYTYEKSLLMTGQDAGIANPDARRAADAGGFYSGITLFIGESRKAARQMRDVCFRKEPD
jgi:hypothetical protein